MYCVIRWSSYEGFSPRKFVYNPLKWRLFYIGKKMENKEKIGINCVK